MNKRYSILDSSQTNPLIKFSEKSNWSRKKIVKNRDWKNGSSLEYLPLVSNEMENISDEEIDILNGSYQCIRKRKLDVPYIEVSDLCTGENSDEKKVTTADPFAKCDFLYKEIQDGDTLQSLSIKYQCPISDLKRANGIISDQEFYGLRTLKIPVKKYSLLSEVLTRTPSETVGGKDIKTIHIGIGPLPSDPPEEAAAFLKKMDEDLLKIVSTTKNRKESLEEVTAALTAPRIRPLVENPYNNADCGMHWTHLILIISIICIILPIIILYTYYLKSAHDNHHNNITSEELTTIAQNANFK